MTIYEKRFYEDFHKLVTIQREILKELKKMNEPLQEDVAIPILTLDELNEKYEKIRKENTNEVMD